MSRCWVDILRHYNEWWKDEKPFPKLALSKGQSRGKEILKVVWFELGHCNHLAITWASWSLYAVDH